MEQTAKDLQRGRCEAFGGMALHFSASAQIPVLAVDPDGAAKALPAAVRMRSQGERFFVRAIVVDRHAALVEALAPVIFKQVPTYDDRRQLFFQLAAGNLAVNGKPMQTVMTHDPAKLVALGDIVRLSEGLVVSSESERRRVQSLLQTRAPVHYVALQDSAVPQPVERRPNGSIVIWAPFLPAAGAAFIAISLHEIHAPVKIVSAAESVPGLRAEWVHPSRAIEVLREASVVVDANPYGADTALALAKWGIPLVVDKSAGAHEHLVDSPIYRRDDFTSICAAVLAALGKPGPERRSPATVEYPRPRSLLQSGPLVSIVIPTMNRKTLLPLTLESIARQEYKNVEAIVVNDGGEPVDDVVKRYPFARLFENKRNMGSAVTVNVGFEQARGQYVGLLADDDVLFPDHVSLLVEALERSGASVAHANVLYCFIDDGPAGAQAYGLQVVVRNAIDVSEMYVTNIVGGSGVLFRRDAVLGAPLDPELPSCRDYGFWMSLIRRFDFVHVDRTTSCYTVRRNLSHMTTEVKNTILDAFKKIYQENPVANRPSVQRSREARLALLEHDPPGLDKLKPALAIVPLAWPPWQ